MRLTIICWFALVTAASPAALAQTTDFSGRWTVDAPPPPAQPAPGTQPAPQRGDLGSGWGSTITIAQDAKQLAVEYSPYTRYDLQPPLKFVYALDGSETKNTMTMGRGEQVESSRASWEGSALTISTTFNVIDRTVDKPFTVQMTRKLVLESPTTLAVEVTRSGVLGGPSTKTRTVYRKG